MRIHEFAKKINKDSKDIIAILQANGIEGKKPASSISESEMNMVLEKLQPEKKEEKKEEPKKNDNVKKENDKKPAEKNNNQGGQNQKKNNNNNNSGKRNDNGNNGGRNNDGNGRNNNNNRNNNNRNNGNNNNNRNNNNRNSNNNNRNNNGRNNKQNNNAKNSSRPVSAPQPKKEEEIKVITIPESITIGELADKMKMQASALIKKLFMQGMMLSVNQEVDFETAENIALEFDIIAEQEEKVDVIEELLKEDEEDETLMVKRPPVVCVMGHVDHGKTSLLDAIRKTNVISGEAGGITQHIGAYVVNYNGEKITFLDTPGHEAFTAMRMRGAQATDIAILVVAADDGVMPQTVEAISHAKAAGISIIVAVNKIDKPSANVEKVKQELAEYELLAEDWGGDTVFVPVSAHTGEGLEQLLEMVLLTAEMNELKANPNRKARGVVIEAKLDKGRGPVATVLVQKGTLHAGDAVAIGSAYGRIRAMVADNGEKIKEAGPSTPVEILGLNNVPNAGEILMSTKNEKEARNIAETFINEGREKLLEGSKAKAKMTLDDVFSQIQAGNLKELNIIVKADVQGSVEAVKQSLVKLSNDEVVVKVIHGGVGAINESDVTLASASSAIIIGFNVRPDNTAKEIADREDVDVRLYRVIYQAIEDVEAAMKGMLDPIYEEKVIGHAEIRQLFKSSGVGMIAGSYILDGTFQRGCKVRISREGTQIFEGDLASLKRFKDDVKEVKAGYECGLVFDGFSEFKELDIVEAYIMVEVPR
ncbi:MAG: translation initiation factor IF-2 [Lachnospiraceae bacterium]